MFDIVTFNVRYRWKGDGINSFINRAGMIYEKVKKEMPDVIAFQEMVPESLEFFKRVFPEYTVTGHGRMKNYNSEGVFTAVKNESLQLIGNEVVWLGPNPYEPESRFPGQSPCPRTLNITTVRRRTDGEILRIYNIHLDEKTEGVRALGMKCALDFVKENNKRLKTDFVILGDFNAEPGGEVWNICKDFEGMKDVTGAFTKTFHDFGKRDEDCKIDYIYVSDGLYEKFIKSELWEEEENGIYLSDHYPISAKFEI